MKKIIIGSSIFVTLLVGSGAAFVYLKNQEVSITNKVNDRKLNIALVNEDTGGSLNGNTYNLGNDFTTLLSKDSSNQWTVMTRNVAENRFENGSVDVIVYIEQQFSEKIAQLESFNPDRAKIAYKTKSNLDPVKSKNVELRVGEHLNTINQNVIKMYFSSVINNLDDAKRNVENIVNEQSGTHSKISQYIYTPSNQASQSITSTMDLVSGLEKNNSSFEELQKKFSESVIKLLNSTGNDLQTKLKEVKDNFDREIENSKQNVSTTNTILNDQYKETAKIVEKINDSASKSLSQFGKNNDTQKSEITKFEDLISNYHKIISGYRDKTNGKKTELEKLQTELEKEKKKVELFYFGKEGVDTKSDLTSESKATLAAQINNSLQVKNSLPDTYQDMIRSTLSETSIQMSDYKELFAKLQKLKVLTPDQVNEYTSKLTLIENYSKFDKKFTPITGLPSFEFLTTENDKLDKITEEIPITVKLPQAGQETATTEISSPISTTPSDTSSLNVESKPEISNASTETKTSTETKYISPKAKISVTGDAKLVNGEQVIADDKTYKLTISYTFEPHYGKNDISFEIHIGDTIIPIKQTIYRSDKEESDVLVKKDLTHIFDKLSKINQAAGMIKAIYGNPNSSSINFSALSPDSVYNMYGNINREDIESQLSNKQITQFKQSGLELLDEIQRTSDSLRKITSEIPELNETNLPNDYFKVEITDLTNWYNTSIQSLSEEYDIWKKTKEKQLETTNSTSESNNNQLKVKIDTAGQLYQSIQSLVTTTSDSSKITNKNHEAVGTMKDQFTQFNSQVKTIKDNIDRTISTTNELITTEANVIQGNRNYADSFKTVMKNIRDGGTTNQNVMSFLSNPIETKKETYATPISVENNRLWIIVAVVVSGITSAGITYWLTKEKK
ncbi:MAG: type VII secretion protein EsaA [Streptococcus mitis]|nr:type VII secretion protein EsaA [Streptococcus mitis]